VLTEAVVGGSAGGPFTLGELVAALSDSGGPRASVAPGVGQRDDAAYQLLSLGYSARETADVVSGRISQRALDNAQRMIAVGKGRDAAADYLDTQYRLVVAARTPARRPSYHDYRTFVDPTVVQIFVSGLAPRRAFDGFIEQYARVHQVDEPLVCAVMHTESAFNPAARSPAGAIAPCS
jgi:transglycosylase-like protein with SLT domain